MGAGHRLERIEFDERRRRFRSACTCGWRSEHQSTAGTAGSEHYRHGVAVDEADAVVRVLAHGTFG